MAGTIFFINDFILLSSSELNLKKFTILTISLLTDMRLAQPLGLTTKYYKQNWLGLNKGAMLKLKHDICH